MKELIVNVEKLETRVALLEDGRLEEFSIERSDRERLAGSIFKGRVHNLEEGLQAAFVDIGVGKNAFLHFWDMEPRTEEDIDNLDGPESASDVELAEPEPEPEAEGEQLDSEPDPVAAELQDAETLPLEPEPAELVGEVGAEPAPPLPEPAEAAPELAAEPEPEPEPEREPEPEVTRTEMPVVRPRAMRGRKRGV